MGRAEGANALVNCQNRESNRPSSVHLFLAACHVMPSCRAALHEHLDQQADASASAHRQIRDDGSARGPPRSCA